MRRALLPRVTPALAAVLLAAVAPAVGTASTAAPACRGPASARSAASAELPRPGTVSLGAAAPRPVDPAQHQRAFKLTYTTKDSHERRARSTGTVLIPHGQPPGGGWPAASRAHGISGLGNTCAPSKVGPVLKQRDWSYLRTWMKQGYAVVASDYVGLGTPGLMPYLDGKAQAHSVVDMVKAGRSFTGDNKRRLRFRRAGHHRSSHAGGASGYTARYASAYGGKRLRFPGRGRGPAPGPTSRTT